MKKGQLRKHLLVANVLDNRTDFTPIDKTVKAIKTRLLFFIVLFLYSLGALADPTQPQSLATVRMQSAQALTNQFTTLFSYHSVFIFNNNFFLNPYTYTFTLCPIDQNCTTYSQVIRLQPHQSINIKYVLTNNVLYTLPAMYSIVATSSIVGSDINIMVTDDSVINVIQPFLANQGQLNS